MLYLQSFNFVDYDREYSFRLGEKRTCFDSMYPFFVLSRHGLVRLDFEQVTILYGGNGSGKTTALNVIAEALSLKRDTLYNRSAFFGDYVNMCSFNSLNIPQNSRMIASDDIFDFMLNLRSVNEGVDLKRELLFEEYLENKHTHFQMNSLEDFEQLKKSAAAKSKTQSKYVRKYLPKNLRERSNGESAYLYFTEKIADNGLYLLDEPENSLSPRKQLELLRFLEDSARFYGCQFVIATHSPFLLSMRGAKIYDFDSEEVDVKRWTDLESVRVFYEFFKKHKGEF